MNTRSFRLGFAFALTLCFLLPTMATADGPQPQINPFSAVAPAPQWFQSNTPDSKTQNVSRVELDGVIYDLSDLASKEENITYLVTPETQKTGVAQGFHSSAEAKSAAAAAGLGCNKADKAATFCIFCDGFNLTGNCVVTACGVAVNTAAPGGIRSFEIGCNLTTVCTGVNRTGACAQFAGVTGVFNYTGATPLLYGSCGF